MDVNDLKELYAEVTKRMRVGLEHVRHELAGVRTGRASVTILDAVHVDAYGARVPLNQVAGLSVPEPTLIVAQPFDPSQIGAIEKAIRASDLGPMKRFAPPTSVSTPRTTARSSAFPCPR